MGIAALPLRVRGGSWIGSDRSTNNSLAQRNETTKDIWHFRTNKDNIRQYQSNKDISGSLGDVNGSPAGLGVDMG